MFLFPARALLLEAAENNDLDKVRQLVERKRVNVNAVDKGGNTPLMRASCKGHLAVVQYLVNTGKAKIEATDCIGETALMIASAWGHLAVVQFLVETAHAKVEAVDNTRMTAFILASLCGHYQIVQFLFETGRANVDAVNMTGWTALRYASSWGHLHVVQFLVETCRAKIEAVDKDGKTALDLANAKGHHDVVAYLQRHHSVLKVATPLPLPSPPQSTMAVPADTTGNDDVVAAASNNNNSDHVVHNDSSQENAAKLEQALLDAARFNNLEIVRQLVEQKKVNVNAADKDGWTALHAASQNGHLQTVQYLIEKGRCNVDAANINGRTPLHAASANKHLKVVQFLVETGRANVAATNNYGTTVLEMAKANGCHDVVAYLQQQMAPAPSTSAAPSSASSTLTPTSKPALVQEPALAPTVSPVLATDQEQMKAAEEGTLNPCDFAEAIALLQQQNESLEAALQSFHPGQDPLQCLSTEQYNVLVGMIGSTCQTQDEEDEKQAILSSPEHCEFYLLLVRKLYCMIHAFETLSSGVVQHNSSGGTSMRAFTTQLLQEKGVDAIKGTKIGVFLSGIVGWVKKNLSAVPFLDTAGSLCQLFLTLKDERERYMSVARVADFATIVTITQSNGDGLRCTVERFARLMVRARIGMSHKPIVEQHDNDDFGRCKQFILKMLGESANTLSKEKASKAADCGFAHLMKPTVGTSLHNLLHQPSLQHLDSFDEALAAATLDTTVDEIRKLNKVCATQVLPMASKVVQQSSVAVAAAAAVVQPRAETTTAVAMTVASQDLDATEAMSRAQAEIERLGREMSFLKKQVKVSSAAAAPSKDLNAGNGLVFADPREKYEDQVQGLARTVQGLAEQGVSHHEQVAVLSREAAQARQERDAMRIKMEQMEKELQSKRGRR